MTLEAGFAGGSALRASGQGGFVQKFGFPRIAHKGVTR